MEYREFEKMMRSTRNTFIRAEKKMNELLVEVANEFPEIELDEMETFAENSENVHEAICCYLQYGESTPKDIWDDILLAQLNSQIET